MLEDEKPATVGLITVASAGVADNKPPKAMPATISAATFETRMVYPPFNARLHHRMEEAFHVITGHVIDPHTWASMGW